MNSVSPGTGANFPVFQSSLACSIRSLREDTKFHNVAWPLQCGAAQKHQTRRARCSHRDTAARMKDRKARPLECLARDLDLSLDHSVIPEVATMKTV
jgi:hypothetical protein